jgi:Na+/proline symporter
MVVLGFVGLSLFTYFQHHPLPADFQYDKVFPRFMSQVFPVGVTGLVIAAIFAASLSSIDGAINSCTSVVIVDFYHRLVLKRTHPEANLSAREQRMQVRISRWATVVLGLAAMLLAANVGRLGDLIEIANKVIQSFTGPILGIFLLGMFSRRARSEGVLLGGVVGAGVAYYVAFSSPLSFLWPSTFGLLSTLGIGYGASVLWRPKAPEREKWTWSQVMALSDGEKETVDG